MRLSQEGNCWAHRSPGHQGLAQRPDSPDSSLLPSGGQQWKKLDLLKGDRASESVQGPQGSRRLTQQARMFW